MADVEMPNSVPCKFDEKGWAQCKKPSTNGWCSKHEKVKCVVCGEHAVRSCDAGSSLCCGADLCGTCQHSLEGSNHVTKQVYDQQLKERHELETTGKESKRMLALRGVPTDVELPPHLGELLRGKHEGFALKVCFYLRIKHGLMGTFPAILKGTKIVLTSPDKESILRVWKSLMPRNSELVADSWMVNEKVGVAYRMSSDASERMRSNPQKIFSKDEIEALFAKDPNPFKWAPGLFGADVSKDQFEQIILQEEA